MDANPYGWCPRWSVRTIGEAFWNIPGMKDQTWVTVTPLSLPTGTMRFRRLQSVQVVRHSPKLFHREGTRLLDPSIDSTDLL